MGLASSPDYFKFVLNQFKHIIINNDVNALGYLNSGHPSTIVPPHLNDHTFTYKLVDLQLWIRKDVYIISHNDNSHPVVKAQNKRAQNELRRARRKFEKILAGIRMDTKSFFAYIRSLSSSSVKPTVLYQQDGNKTSSPDWGPEETCK